MKKKIMDGGYWKVNTDKWKWPEDAANEIVNATEYTEPTEEGKREAEGFDVKHNKLFDHRDLRNKFKL